MNNRSPPPTVEIHMGQIQSLKDSYGFMTPLPPPPLPPQLPSPRRPRRERFLPLQRPPDRRSDAAQARRLPPVQLNREEQQNLGEERQALPVRDDNRENLRDKSPQQAPTRVHLLLQKSLNKL